MANVSIVIPVYSEQECIREMLDRLMKVQADSPQDSFEFIFVDDGSYDQTLPLLRELAAANDKVKYVSFSRNFGHEAALTAGLDHACGQAVISLDGDLQHPPELIPQLVAKWREGYQIVYAQRQVSESIPWLKNVSSRAFYWLIRRGSATELPPNTANFRLMDRRVVEQFRRLREHNRFGRGLVAWTGFKQASIPYKEDARFAGATKYSMLKSARLAMDAFMSFSNFPLQLIFWAGGLFIGLAVAILLVAIVRLLAFGALPSGTSLIIFCLFATAGVLLVAMGLLGSYIGRIYRHSQDRPLYIVAEKSGSLPPGHQGAFDAQDPS